MQHPDSPLSASPAEDAGPTPKPERRWYVALSKRGKKMSLTLNGGVLFKDPDLAINGARAAMKRDGWTRAVVTEMELDEVKPTSDGVDRFWRVIGTVTLTPHAKEKSNAR